MVYVCNTGKNHYEKVENMNERLCTYVYRSIDHINHSEGYIWDEFTEIQVLYMWDGDEIGRICQINKSTIRINMYDAIMRRWCAEEMKLSEKDIDESNDILLNEYEDYVKRCVEWDVDDLLHGRARPNIHSVGLPNNKHTIGKFISRIQRMTEHLFEYRYKINSYRVDDD